MVRKAARACAGVILFAATAASLSACSPNQPPSTTAGTTPSIWTGSPAPTGTLSQPEGPVEPDSLTTHLSSPDGIEIAVAKFEFDQDYVRITVTTTEVGQLTPGFHGLHIHSVGKCEADSVAPTGGAPGDFNSAGGHFQVPGRTAHPASGDLTSLQVRNDGAALLVTTTSAFTKKDLLAGSKTSIIIHADADNFDNIPPARYTQTDGVPGPDQITTTTGDAGKRLACGVIGAG